MNLSNNIYKGISNTTLGIICPNNVVNRKKLLPKNLNLENPYAPKIANNRAKIVVKIETIKLLINARGIYDLKRTFIKPSKFIVDGITVGG